MKYIFLALSYWVLTSCTTTSTKQQPAPSFSTQTQLDLEMPEVNVGEKVFKRAGYFINFDQKSKVAKWVAYRLTRDEVNTKIIKRTDNFKYDEELDSAKPSDYTRTGYDRGHLVPAEDQRWSKQAMADSFLMSNMAPQKPCFNRGIWKKLESKVRDWAKKFGEIYIVTGPVGKPTDKLPGTSVGVPDKFFKAILATQTNPPQAIGFVFSNSCNNADLQQMAFSVEDVEQATSLNFFVGISDNIESTYDLTLWNTN